MFKIVFFTIKCISDSQFYLCWKVILCFFLVFVGAVTGMVVQGIEGRGWGR
jgi:hypothetical protein